MTKEPGTTSKEQLIIYLYDLMQNKYLGYINLNKLIDQENLQISQIDFIFSSATSKGSLTVFFKDSLYLIAESSREGIRGKWTLIRK